MHAVKEIHDLASGLILAPSPNHFPNFSFLALETRPCFSVKAEKDCQENG